MAETINYLSGTSGINAPYSVEAEQAVLGSIIIDPDCINLVATQIKEEYFYLKEHREIYKTLRGMLELGGKAIDFVSLLEQLKRNGVMMMRAESSIFFKSLIQVSPQENDFFQHLTAPTRSETLEIFLRSMYSRM